MKNIVCIAYDDRSNTDYDLCRFATIQFSEENLKSIKDHMEIMDKYPWVNSFDLVDIGIVEFMASDKLTEENENYIQSLLKDKSYCFISNEELIKIWDIKAHFGLTRKDYLTINRYGFLSFWALSHTFTPQRLETCEIKISEL
jgi:hypothetical protein